MDGFPNDFAGVLLTTALLGVPVFYIALQVRRIRELRGRWRTAATLPVVAWAAWIAILIIAPYRAEPWSELAVLEALLGCVLGVVYLWLLALYRRHRQVAAEMAGKWHRG
jgi:hypothetical protein